MKKTRKTFDAVQLMRNLRQQISTEIEGMTPEEELAYFQQHAQGRGPCPWMVEEVLQVLLEGVEET